MEINYPTGNQEARLQTLWRLAFGDPEELIAGFFASGYSPPALSLRGGKRERGRRPLLV